MKRKGKRREKRTTTTTKPEYIPGGTSREEPSGRGHGNLPQHSCLEDSTERRVWQATVLGAAKSQTRLKQLSMHLRLNKEDKSEAILEIKII